MMLFKNYIQDKVNLFFKNFVFDKNAVMCTFPKINAIHELDTMSVLCKKIDVNTKIIAISF